MDSEASNTPILILRPRKAPNPDIKKMIVTAYGGFDPQIFVRDKLDKYLCKICSKVFRDPHITSCCGFHYCESCLDYTAASVCPNCGAKGESEFKHFCDQGWKRKIGSFKVYCSLSKDKGCEWVGELRFLPEHNSKLCMYRQTSCERCDKAILVKDLDKHIKEECMERIVHCEHCDLEGPYQWITTKHNLLCELVPLSCPNKCGERIERKDLDAHNQICPKCPVQCPFAEVGCIEMPQRCMLEKHQASAKDNHLQLAMTSYVNEKEKKQSEQKRCQIIEKKMSLASEYVDTLMQSCSSKQLVLLNTLRSMLSEKSYSLKDPEKDRVTIRMDDYRKYQNKEWSSPPFYVYFNPEGDYGYKMCLTVLSHSGKENAAKGQRKPVISLLLLKGEYDRFLSWPIRTSLKIDNFQGIVVKMENLKFQMEMHQQTKKSVAGKQGTLNPFHSDLILDSEQLNDEPSRVIDEVYIRDNFESMSFNGALEFSVYMDVPF